VSRFRTVPPGAKVVGGIPEVPTNSPPSTAKQRLQALGRLPTGTMNRTEAAYAALLEQGRMSGTVAWWKFEGVKLRLADSTFYTPDFNVMMFDGLLAMIEVKGHWADDARVKIKVAASIYPFRFVAVKAKAKSAGGGWEEEVFGE
jgi:hypothetical protein